MKNFRELSYGNIKKGMLFRSEELSNASKEDGDFLLKKGIKVIVDIRTTSEQIKKPDMDIPGIKHISLPLFEPANLDKPSVEERRKLNVQGLELTNMTVIYRQLAGRKRSEAWSEIFNILIENDGVLFHCSEGKDRTGVVSAIILTALGIDIDTVYKDYLLTNESPLFLVPSPDFLVGSGLDDSQKMVVFNHFKAHKEYLDAFFDEINKVYGSIDAFLADCCNVDSTKIDILRKKYLY